ncbi:MAG: hypothetical protein JM58_03490 [Peptococcaceae bacterium BICA1-8]|nr:MAG: hypothetical protein JM58_03490 [Peptococcaceae bacterium BICA1-8]
MFFTEFNIDNCQQRDKRGVSKLLLFSYMLAAALELVMAVKNYQLGNLSYAWSFGFLLFLSAGSIPLETSNMGKMVRAEFKSLGVDTARYDLLSNLGRSFAYILIVINIFNYIEGLILAYGITFVMLAVAIYKYTRAEK